jgi:hypothetical protein
MTGKAVRAIKTAHPHLRTPHDIACLQAAQARRERRANKLAAAHERNEAKHKAA